jgi:hypothetical protein
MDLTGTIGARRHHRHARRPDLRRRHRQQGSARAEQRDRHRHPEHPGERHLQRSRLSLNRFAGTTANGGKVTGSGTIDLSNIVSRGVALDLRMAAQNARIVNRDDMAATVTGPLRIVSDGIGGTIAGRCASNRRVGRSAAPARWRSCPRSPRARSTRVPTSRRRARRPRHGRS